ncbi:MAG: hypothetical protein WCD76_04025 [Pyrinomonadaceae bacterium]
MNVETVFTYAREVSEETQIEKEAVLVISAELKPQTGPLHAWRQTTLAR